jgi:hypothetical protein
MKRDSSVPLQKNVFDYGVLFETDLYCVVQLQR